MAHADLEAQKRIADEVAARARVADGRMEQLMAQMLGLQRQNDALQQQIDGGMSDALRPRPLLTPPNDGTQMESKLDLRVALKKGAGHVDWQEVEDLEAKAADQMFGKLDLSDATRLSDLWSEFRMQTTLESQIALAIDRAQPIIQTLHSVGTSWAEIGVTYSDIEKNRRRSFPDIFPSFGWNFRYY